MPLHRLHAPKSSDYIYQFTRGEYRRLVHDGDVDALEAWYGAYYDHAFDGLFYHFLALRTLRRVPDDEYVAQYDACHPTNSAADVHHLSARIRRMFDMLSDSEVLEPVDVSAPKVTVKNIGQEQQQ